MSSTPGYNGHSTTTENTLPLTKRDTVPINGKRLAYYRQNSTNLVPKRKGGVPSTYDLAAASGVSRSYISEIEKGKKQPSYRVARDLAAAVGVGVDDLIS